MKPSATGACQASEEISRRKNKRFISKLLLPHLMKQKVWSREIPKIIYKIYGWSRIIWLSYSWIGVYCEEHFMCVRNQSNDRSYIIKPSVVPYSIYAAVSLMQPFLLVQHAVVVQKMTWPAYFWRIGIPNLAYKHRYERLVPLWHGIRTNSPDSGDASKFEMVTSACIAIN